MPCSSSPSLARATKAFRVIDGEVAVESALVKRIEIGTGTAIVTFRNSGTAPVQPDFMVRVFNGYGMELGAFRQKWALERLAPGAVKKENASFATPDLDEVFRFSRLALPGDWRKPVFVLIDGPAF